MITRNKLRPTIGAYGKKTRAFQRKITRDIFALSYKTANVYMYLGSRKSANPSINDIQNKVFFEVPDRAYSDEPKTINIGMDSVRAEKMDFSRFGLINPMADEQVFRVHIDDMLECMSRTMIIGDVLEVPFFEENCNKAFWEVTDVDKDIKFEQFYVVIHAVPLGDSRTTNEIPIERSNDDLMNDIMTQTKEHSESVVPTEGLNTYDVDPDAPYPEADVDYRDDKQSSFLDDPQYTFNNKDKNR